MERLTQPVGRDRKRRTPHGGRTSLKEWVRGAAGDAKEGGSNGVAPHEIDASRHEPSGGALVGTGGGWYLALGRLPGGIRGHDVAVGQVHARRRPILPGRSGISLGQHPGGNAASTDASHGHRAATPRCLRPVTGRGAINPIQNQMGRPQDINQGPFGAEPNTVVPAPPAPGVPPGQGAPGGNLMPGAGGLALELRPPDRPATWRRQQEMFRLHLRLRLEQPLPHLNPCLNDNEAKVELRGSRSRSRRLGTGRSRSGHWPRKPLQKDFLRQDHGGLSEAATRSALFGMAASQPPGVLLW